MAELPPKKILLVADYAKLDGAYGKEDMAFAEVRQVLYDLAEQAGQRITVDIVSTDSFNTAQGAAIVAEAAKSGQYDLVYHNIAPRKANLKAQANNAGEGLAYAHVQGRGGKETAIVGVNSGNAEQVNTFSLLPPGTEVYHVDSAAQGSQFRSRDVFPEHVIAALSGDIKLLERFTPPRSAETIDWKAPTFDKASRVLREAQAHQLSQHGDASEGYITVITPRETAAATVKEVAERAGSAEVDALPLKSSRNSDIEAGFAAAQLALNSEHAPRRSIVALTGSDTLQTAATLYEARLDNGAAVITDDLKALRFVKNRLAGEVEAYHSDRALQVSGEGALTVSGIAQALTRGQLEAAIPALEHPTPAYTDGYGNIKLAQPFDKVIAALGAATGQGERTTVDVTIGGKKVEATVADGSFAVQDGDFALSRGSSGWPKEPGGKKEFYPELFERGGHAADRLGHPQPGDVVELVVKDRKTGLLPQVVGVGNADPSPAVDQAKHRGVI